MTFASFSVVTFFTPLRSAMIGLGLNEAAYMSEIARAGLLAVDEGQIEAASSLGMTRRPEPAPGHPAPGHARDLPPTGNEVISMLKTTSLASSVGVTELLGAATNIYGGELQAIQLLVMASIWYLMVTTVLSWASSTWSATSPSGPCGPRRRPRSSACARTSAASRPRPASPRPPRAGQPVSAAVDTPMVEAKGVHKSFAGVQVLKGVDFVVTRGEVTCLIGPSGSGKCTLCAASTTSRSTTREN